jgi:Flp pilus assembly protein TadB
MLPVLAVGYVAISLLAVLVILLLVAISPPLAIIIATALILATGVLPIILGRFLKYTYDLLKSEYPNAGEP